MLEQRASASPGIVGLRAGLAWTLCWLDRREEAAGDPRAGGERPLRARLAGVGRRSRRLCCTPTPRCRQATPSAVDPATSASSRSPIRSSGTALPAWGHVRMYLGLLAAVLGRHEQADRAPGVRVRVPRGQRHAAVGRPRPAGLGRSARRARRRCAQPASTPPVRSSSRASTATASSSRARRRSSRRSPRPRPTVAEPRCCPTRLLRRRCELLCS